MVLREVSKQEGIIAAKSMGCPYGETSARTGNDVIEAFEMLVQQIITLKSNATVETAQKGTTSACCCIQ